MILNIASRMILLVYYDITSLMKFRNKNSFEKHLQKKKKQQLKRGKREVLFFS